MGVIDINISGLDELKDRLKNAPAKLNKEIDAELQASVMKMREGALKDAPGDQGRLRGTIQQQKVGEMQHGMFAQSEYAAFQEFGTKGQYKAIPGYEAIAAEYKGVKTGTWKEFLKRITEWVRRKGLAGTYQTGIKTKTNQGFGKGGKKGTRRKNKTNALEDIEVAYIIARSIYRKGIKPQPFFFKQLDKEKPNLIKNIENILSKI